MRVKRQYPAIDIAKYISALLVVAIHVYPFEPISPLFHTFFTQTVCRLAVPFFFAASAFFFFRHKENLEDIAALKEYELRVLRLYLVWTVIYLPYTIWNYAEAGFTFASVISWLRDFLLNGSYYHLWFLPAMMLGMALLWFGQRRFGLKKTLLAALGLYLIGYLINVYAVVWENMPVMSVLYGYFTKTLVTARDGIFFAPLFLGIGLLAARGVRVRETAGAIGFVVSFICLILEVTAYYLTGILYDTASMFLSLIPCTFFLFSWLLTLRIKYSPQYKILRTDSTVIYTSQLLFIRLFTLMLPGANLVVYFLTLACCQGLAALIIRYEDRFPVLKLLV